MVLQDKFMSKGGGVKMQGGKGAHLRTCMPKLLFCLERV